MSIETQGHMVPRDHVVQFYERDEHLVATVGAYAAEGLGEGEAVIVLATAGHLADLRAWLATNGVDTAAEGETGRLVFLDADDMLAQLLLGEEPNSEFFATRIGALVRQAAGAGRPVRAYGELVALLWAAGHIPAAIEFEALWNDLGLEVRFSLFCAYASDLVRGESQGQALREVCDLHSAIIGSGWSPPGPVRGPDGSEAVDDFVQSLGAPGEARRFVRRTLEEWGRPELVADAMTLVSELATNAVIHARSDFTVVVASPGGRVRISVLDASPAPPVLLDPVASSASGRGIMLVAAIANAWGAHLSTQGKTVWAELRQ